MNLSRNYFNLIVGILSLTLIAGCGGGSKEPVDPNALTGSMQIKGSDTMVNLGQIWAEEFMIENPETSIAVTGGGSGTGIASLINGTCDIAQASRKMKQKEIDMATQAGRHVHEIQAGIDALAVIVHPENPVKQLTLTQLSGIFQGAIKNWSEVGGDPGEILVLSRERNSGTHVYFLEEVVRLGNAKGPEEFAVSALMLSSSQAMTEETATSLEAIGYVGLGYVTDNVATVSVGKEGGTFVLPSVETALDGSYLLSRPLYIYTANDPNELVQTFLDYVLGPEGQELVLEMDFVPLRTER